MKKIKTSDVLVAYNILSGSRYSNLSDVDKIKVWKIAREMKPIATKFEEDAKDASEKFRPEGDYNEMLQKAQDYERIIRNNSKEETPISDKEYKEFVEGFKSYQNLVNAAINEFANKEVEFNFEPLSEEAFGKLMSSNDWTIDQSMTLGDILM
jgi:hypothetical protein